jgi:hypothetical protein
MSGSGGGSVGTPIDKLARDIKRLAKYGRGRSTVRPKGAAVLELTAKQARHIKIALKQILNDEVFCDPQYHKADEVLITPSGALNGKQIKAMLATCTEVLAALKTQGV